MSGKGEKEIVQRVTKELENLLKEKRSKFETLRQELSQPEALQIFKKSEERDKLGYEIIDLEEKIKASRRAVLKALRQPVPPELKKEKVRVGC